METEFETLNTKIAAYDVLLGEYTALVSIENPDEADVVNTALKLSEITTKKEEMNDYINNSPTLKCIRNIFKKSL